MINHVLIKLLFLQDEHQTKEAESGENYLCDQEIHEDSIFAPNMDEDTNVTQSIDESTWNKIIEKTNLHLRDSHGMTKEGYCEVLLTIFLLVLCYKHSICSQVIQNLADEIIKNCHTYKIHNTYYNFKRNCLITNLICTRTKSCTCYWKAWITANEFNLKRFNSPNHVKAHMKERRKLSSKQTGF